MIVQDDSARNCCKQAHIALFLRLFGVNERQPGNEQRGDNGGGAWREEPKADENRASQKTKIASMEAETELASCSYIIQHVWVRPISTLTVWVCIERCRSSFGGSDRILPMIRRDGDGRRSQL